MDTVRMRWNGNRQFVGWDEAGHGVVLDASANYKGEGTGARPLQLVLYGLAGCTGMDVVSILEKKRQDVRGLELTVEGTQRLDDYPKYYEHVNVHFKVTGVGVKPEAVERAIELSETKYCSVQGMFGDHVRVTSSYEVVEVELSAAE